jgi:hypothetical protein
MCGSACVSIAAVSWEQKAVKRSPVLQALKGGVTGSCDQRNLGDYDGSDNQRSIARVGGWWCGWCRGMFLEAGRSYMKALQERRKGRLIMDIAMMFDQQQPVDN